MWFLGSTCLKPRGLATSVRWQSKHSGTIAAPSGFFGFRAEGSAAVAWAFCGPWQDSQDSAACRLPFCVASTSVWHSRQAFRPAKTSGLFRLSAREPTR